MVIWDLIKRKIIIISESKYEICIKCMLVGWFPKQGAQNNVVFDWLEVLKDSMMFGEVQKRKWKRKIKQFLSGWMGGGVVSGEKGEISNNDKKQ